MSATQHAVTRPVRQILIRNNAGIYEACLIQRRPDLQFTQTPASKNFQTTSQTNFSVFLCELIICPMPGREPQGCSRSAGEWRLKSCTP
jgi:hypothetical protein